MRMMVRWTVPVDRGNEAIADGSLVRLIQEMTERLKPEAAYYWPEAGDRGGMMVFQMTDSSEIAQVAEPLFLQLDAEVQFVPVMNADDLQKALAAAGA